VIDGHVRVIRAAISVLGAWPSCLSCLAGRVVYMLLRYADDSTDICCSVKACEI